MIKDKRIFDGATLILNGNKVRVLTTPYHINRSEIPDELFVYALIKKGDHYMVDDMNTTNTDDFVMSMISHTELAIGIDIKLEQCDPLYGVGARMSIQEYFVETVGTIKLYVMMATDDVATDEIRKRLNAARRCFAIACGRNIDDVEILNQVSEIDPYGIDTNFENDVDRNIYRLTKKLRIMGKATNILDMSKSYSFILRNPCCVEHEVCMKYDLNRIDVSLVDAAVRRIQKESNDLDIIMGKTAVVGTPTRPYYFGNPNQYRTPSLGGDYNYICDSASGFQL